MKELKFRAWDKFNETMVYPKGILSDGRIVVFSCGSLDAWEGYEIMQYTGLKDKNGREIYEGDVVIVHECEDFKWTDTVEFHHGGFWVDENCLGAIHTFSEVIGNIYENPELLKGDEINV